jgi:AraC-like DNA-binding protein
MKFVRQGCGEFTSERTLGPAVWPHHDLLFVHEGRIALEFTALGREVALTRHTGVLIWPQTPFRGRILTRQARASIQHFLVGGGASAPFDRLSGQRGGFSVQPVGPSVWVDACIRRLLDARDATTTEEAEIRRRARLALALAEGGFLGGGNAGVPARVPVEPLRTWARANLSRNLAVSDLARRANLSPSRFRDVFYKEHGITAGEFLRVVRCEEAQRLLAETERPLKEIAVALGFADAVVFHRAFKSRTGQTPGEYRRRHRIVG